ncbi:MAG: hypothetical protein KAY65_05550 [Planctomycetes bacterium]|nr:hypothetical protein [Planctomycetota bacterium]
MSVQANVTTAESPSRGIFRFITPQPKPDSRKLWTIAVGDWLTAGGGMNPALEAGLMKR